MTPSAIPLANARTLAVLILASLLAGRGIAQPAIEVHDGMAEASAAAALDARTFVVAEDECNTLLIYEAGTRSPVGERLKLAHFLGTGREASDIEGAARVGDVVYWISSHSLTKKGNSREWRKRFFATRVDTNGSRPSVRPAGQPYKKLLDDLIANPVLKDLKLAEAAKIAPEEKGGLNIEGLAAWHEGSLLIGFRNPLDEQGNAVLVPLENPDAVIEGGRPRFGAPLRMDLGGRGIRSIDLVGDDYLIVAGPTADAGTFSLYRWTGRRTDRPQLRPDVLPPGFAAEALFALPGARAMILSDDGTPDTEPDCDRPVKASQKFRALLIDAR